MFIPPKTNKRDSIWVPMKTIGKLKVGRVREPGIGKYERSYQFILNNNFIEIRNNNLSPTDKNPKGEVHEDYRVHHLRQKVENFP